MIVRPSAEIAKRVAHAHDVTTDQIFRQSKSRDVVLARQAYWAALILELGYSLTQTGRTTKHDHTTVLYGLRSWASRELKINHRAGVEEIRTAWIKASHPASEVA